jgi:peptidoglycan hydrolase-like protein with peptidoglycan-binding domain
LAVARNVVALLTAILMMLVLFAGAGAVWAQGSLHLPPLPDAKPAPTSPTPESKPESQSGSQPPKSGMRAGQIQAIQLLLRDLGFYDNTTNGTLGPATRTAIREFQRSNGDPETGEPSEKLLEDLRKAKPR